MASRRLRLQVRPNTGNRALRDTSNTATQNSSVSLSKSSTNQEVKSLPNDNNENVSQETASKLNRLVKPPSPQIDEVNSKQSSDIDENLVSSVSESVNENISKGKPGRCEVEINSENDKLAAEHSENAPCTNFFTSCANRLEIFDVNSSQKNKDSSTAADINKVLEILKNVPKPSSDADVDIKNDTLRGSDDIVDINKDSPLESIKDASLQIPENSALGRTVHERNLDIQNTKEIANNVYFRTNASAEVGTSEITGSENSHHRPNTETAKTNTKTLTADKSKKDSSKENFSTLHLPANNETEAQNINKQDRKLQTPKPLGRFCLPKVQPNIRDTGRRRNRQQTSSSDTEDSGKCQKLPPSVNRMAVPDEEEPVSSLHEVNTTAPATETPIQSSSGGAKQVTFSQIPTKVPEKKTTTKPAENNEVLAQKRKHYRRGLTPPERKNMTMLDLIYWNPPNNPMKSSSNSPSIRVISDEVESVRSTSVEEEATDNPSGPVEDTDLPCPQLMLGPNGEITLDENSLVIQRTEPEPISSQEVICEVAETTYASFRKPSVKRGWSDKETAKFYKALSVVGTDFSLMSNLFPHRSRHELKNKFKREERYNRELVDKAINDPQQFDLTGFDEDNDEDFQDKPKKRSYKRKPKQPENSTEAENGDESGMNDVVAPRRKRRRVEAKSYCNMENDSENDIVELEDESSVKVKPKKHPRKRKEKHQENSGTAELLGEINQLANEVTAPKKKKRRRKKDINNEISKQKRKRSKGRPKGGTRISDDKDGDLESDDELQRTMNYLNSLRNQRGRRKKLNTNRVDVGSEQLEIQDLSGHVSIPPCDDSGGFVEVIPADLIVNPDEIKTNGCIEEQSITIQNLEPISTNGVYQVEEEATGSIGESVSSGDKSRLENDAFSILNSANAQTISIPLSPMTEGNEAAEQLILLASRTPTHEQVVHVYLVSSPPPNSSNTEKAPINTVVEKHLLNNGVSPSTSVNRDINQHSELPTGIIRQNSNGTS